MTESIALNGSTVALVHHGALTIMEAQQEFEGEQGTTVITPSKSIAVAKYSAMELRDFLNKHYPVEGEHK